MGKTSMEAELAKYYGGDKDFWQKWLAERIGNAKPENDHACPIALIQEARDIIEKDGLVGYYKWYVERRKTGGGFVELHGPKPEPEPVVETHTVYIAPTTPVEKRSACEDIRSWVMERHKCDYLNQKMRGKDEQYKV